MCKISVIIPVYNSSLYLKQCLDSVLKQSFTDFEVICVDNCSTDDSLKILEKYSKSDKRLVVLKNMETQGPAMTRNRGLAVAKGDFIYFLDSDDWIMPKAFEVMSEKAEQYNADVVLFDSYGDAEEVGLTLPSLNWDLEKDKYDRIMTGQEAFSCIVENNTWNSAVWRQFWRKSFLNDNKIEFENKRIAEDWIFTTISLLTAERVVFINTVLHTYRRHKKSISHSYYPEMVKDYALNYMSMLSFWMSHTFPKETNYSIKLHMDRFAEKIRNMHARCGDDNSSEMFDDLIHQHLYQLITNINRPLFLERNLDEDFVNKLKKYKHIYIYGAARYAIQMYEQLIKWNVDVQGFVVTEFTKAKSIYDLPVLKLEDAGLDNENVVFVLGVSSKNRKEIINNLELHGFKNYLSL